LSLIVINDDDFPSSFKSCYVFYLGLLLSSDIVLQLFPHSFHVRV